MVGTAHLPSAVPVPDCTSETEGTRVAHFSCQITMDKNDDGICFLTKNGPIKPRSRTRVLVTQSRNAVEKGPVSPSTREAARLQYSSPVRS